jgi:hypothetical protein
MNHKTPLLALGEPNFPTLPFHELFYDGQSHSATFNIVPRSECLEHAENPTSELLGNAGSVVRHDELDRGTFLPGIDPDMTTCRVVMMLDRIAEEVLEGLCQRCTRCIEDRKVGPPHDLEALGRAHEYGKFRN